MQSKTLPHPRARRPGGAAARLQHPASPEVNRCRRSEINTERWVGSGCVFAELFCSFLQYQNRIWEVTYQACMHAHRLAHSCKPQLPSGYFWHSKAGRLKLQPLMVHLSLLGLSLSLSFVPVFFWISFSFPFISKLSKPHWSPVSPWKCLAKAHRRRCMTLKQHLIEVQSVARTEGRDKDFSTNS